MRNRKNISPKFNDVLKIIANKNNKGWSEDDQVRFTQAFESHDGNLK